MRIPLITWAENDTSVPSTYFSFIVKTSSRIAEGNLMLYFQETRLHEIAENIIITTSEVETVMESLSDLTPTERETSECHLFSTSQSFRGLRTPDGELDLAKFEAFLYQIPKKFHVDKVTMLEYEPVLSQSPTLTARFFHKAPSSSATAGAGSLSEESLETPSFK